MTERYKIVDPSGGEQFASTKEEVAAIVEADKAERFILDISLGRPGDGCSIQSKSGGCFTIYRVPVKY